MSAACVRARMLAAEGVPQAVTLADAFCREARQRIAVSFRNLYGKHDPALYKLSQQVLRGEHAWLEGGIVSMLPHEHRAADAAAAPPEPRAERLRREEVGV